MRSAAPQAVPDHSWAQATLVDLATIREAVEPAAVLDAVRAALIAHAEGRTLSPAPGQLLFRDPPGDCHVKFGAIAGAGIYVVKVASGFYRNAARGRPVNNGLMLVFSATTGQTLAILDDQGELTALRTAAAGALAAMAGAPRPTRRPGIVGAGRQAQLQAVWASRALGGVGVTVWGRGPSRPRSWRASCAPRRTPACSWATSWPDAPCCAATRPT